MTPALDIFEVTPEPVTPMVVFAGDAPGEGGHYQLTAFLVFEDEAEAIAALPGLWIAPEVEGE